MSENWLPIAKTEQGLTHEIAFDGDRVLSRTHQDKDQLNAILDQAKAMASHNSGYSPDKTFRRVAIIPDFVATAWANETPPIDWRSTDPWVQKEIKRRLNSNEFMFLRTAPGQI